MLRRCIPFLIVVLGIALVAETAAAGPFGRRGGRNQQNSDSQVVTQPQQQTVTQQGQVVTQQEVVSPQDVVVNQQGQLVDRQGRPVTMVQEQGSRGRRGRRSGSGSTSVYYVVSQQQQQVSRQGDGYRSYYFTPSVNVPQGAVLLNVQVPADAQVWLDGEKTTSTGSLRSFVSPPLTPGKRYSYELKARWMQNGQEVVRTRKVIVQAGEAVDVDLTRATRQELDRQQAR